VCRLVWKWGGEGAESAPNVSVDPAVVKRFCVGHVTVALQCAVVAGRGLPADLEGIALQLSGSGKLVDPKSKQALSAFFPSAAPFVDVENGMDLSRQIRAFHLHRVPSDAELPQLVVPPSEQDKQATASLDVYVVGYFAPDTTVASMVALLVEQVNRIEWVWRMHGTAAATEAVAFRPPEGDKSVETIIRKANNVTYR
jgi:hypothetical protein